MRGEARGSLWRYIFYWEHARAACKALRCGGGPVLRHRERFKTLCRVGPLALFQTAYLAGGLRRGRPYCEGLTP